MSTARETSTLPRREIVTLYSARDIINVDSDIKVNMRLNMHLLHNCTHCKYCPTSSLSLLRHGERSMSEILVCHVGRAKIFITSCSAEECMAVNTANAETVKGLYEKAHN
jgi:hypothetical protein